MTQLTKRGRTQLQLLLEPVRTLQHPIEDVRSEVIAVLADLLLEAMGPEEAEQGAGEEVSDEREDHA
jgi:hypothetical protein